MRSLATLLIGMVLPLVFSACFGSAGEGECSQDDQCQLGQICVEGACQTGCRVNRDCADALVCLPDQGDHGECVDCVRSSDCADAQVCVDHQCRGTCVSDAACPDGYCDLASETCVACLTDSHCTTGTRCLVGRCVSGCDSDSQCAAGQICEQAVCLPGCRQDEDCLSGHCDLANLACIECIDKDDCPLGRVCVAGDCRLGCESDRDCSQPPKCKDDEGLYGLCVDCLADGDCAGDESCLQNHCAAVCLADLDCPAGEICDADRCRPGCRLDSDCIGGRCDPQSLSCVACVSKDDCQLGYLCQDGSCLAGCEGVRDCPGDQDCVDGQCQAPPCSSRFDCVGSECLICTDGACVPPPVSCFSDDECCVGFACLGWTCVPAECSSAQDCAFMQECSAGSCVDAYSEATPYCQPCGANPFGPTECGDIENRCLIYPYTDEFSAVSANYCAVDCQSQQDCPSGFVCRDVQLLGLACTLDSDCADGIPCLMVDGSNSGYCPCHPSLNPCLQDGCLINFCFRSGRSCTTDADCPLIECVVDEAVGYGSCVVGTNCALDDNNHCPAP